MTYEQYLDKVYGCFLGKTVAGTMGAPYEGIKMPLELEFKPEMINTMLPNDDLDLQVLIREKMSINTVRNEQRKRTKLKNRTESKIPLSKEPDVHKGCMMSFLVIPNAKSLITTLP